MDELIGKTINIPFKAIRAARLGYILEAEMEAPSLDYILNTGGQPRVHLFVNKEALLDALSTGQNITLSEQGSKNERIAR